MSFQRDTGQLTRDLPPGFKTTTYTFKSGGQILNVNLDCNTYCVDGQPSSSVISLQTNQGISIPTIGRAYKTDGNTKILTISSSVAGVVTLTTGFGLLTLSGGQVGPVGNVGIEVIDDATGVLTPVNGHKTAYAGGPTIEQVDVVEGILDLSSGGRVIRTGNGITGAASVQGVNGGIGFNFNPPFTITGQPQQYQVFKVNVFLTDAVNPATFLDQNGMILNVYPADGSGPLLAIPAGAVAGTIFYIPLAGVTNITINSASGNTWTFNGGFGPFPFVPKASALRVQTDVLTLSGTLGTGNVPLQTLSGLTHTPKQFLSAYLYDNQFSVQYAPSTFVNGGSSANAFIWLQGADATDAAILAIIASPVNSLNMYVSGPNSIRVGGNNVVGSGATTVTLTLTYLY